MAIFLSLSGIFTIVTVNVSAKNLKAQLLLSFHHASLLEFRLFLVEKEDFSVATLVQNEFIHVVFVSNERFRIGNVERMLARKASFI